MKSEYDTVDNVDELLDQLKPLFPGGILDYNGDEELISSCNAEYRFCEDDIFTTDGSINVRMSKCELVDGNEREEGICLNTIIRGATYIIEYSIEYPDHLSLRIDRSKVDERKIEEIKNKLKSFKENLEDSIYAATSITKGLGDICTFYHLL